MNKKRTPFFEGKKLIDDLGYQKLFELITSGVKFKYISYDHKRAMQEYSTSEKYRSMYEIIKNPKSYDMPKELKEKYRVIRVGKLRRIDFNRLGKACKFYIGNKFYKRYYLDDFGITVVPFKEEFSFIEDAKFMTLDNHNQTASLKQHIFIPKLRTNYLGDNYIGNISLCGQITVREDEIDIDISNEKSELYYAEKICVKCHNKYLKIKELSVKNTQ